MHDKSQLEAELASLHDAIAALDPPRLLPVHLVQWLPRPQDSEAVLHLASFGPTPELHEVVETIDAAGVKGLFRITSTAGLLALGSAAGSVRATLAKPLPAKLVELRELEMDLVARATVAIALPSRVAARARPSRRLCLRA